MARNRQRIAGWGINPFGDKPENGNNKGVCWQEEGKGSGPTREAEELEQKFGHSKSCFCWHPQLPRNVNTTGAGPLNAICHSESEYREIGHCSNIFSDTPHIIPLYKSCGDGRLTDGPQCSGKKTTRTQASDSIWTHVDKELEEGKGSVCCTYIAHVNCSGVSKPPFILSLNGPQGRKISSSMSAQLYVKPRAIFTHHSPADSKRF